MKTSVVKTRCAFDGAVLSIVLAVAGNETAVVTAADEAVPGVVARLGSHKFVHQERIRSLAFSPDGSALFTDAGSEACVWDVATGKKRQVFKLTGSTTHAAISRDWRTVVLTENNPPTLHIFNAATSECRAKLIGAKEKPRALALSPDGLRAASGDGGDVVVWDLEHAKELRRCKADEKLFQKLQFTPWIAALQFSPDGQRITYAYPPRRSSEGEMWIRGVDAEDPPARLEGGTGFHPWLVFSPDGKTVAGSCETVIPKGRRSCLRFWDSATGRTLQNVPGSFCAGAFSPDGSRFAATDRQIVRIHDCANAKELHHLPTPHEEIGSVAFSPDGIILATGQGHHVRFWNTETWREINPGHGHDAPVQAVAVAPDGRTIATGGQDGRIILWAWPEARERRRIEPVGSHWGVQHLRFSPDGRIIAATAWINGGDTFFLHDAATGAPVSRFGKSHQGKGPVAFLADGKEVLTGARNAMCVWEAASGNMVRLIGGPKKPASPAPSAQPVAASPTQTNTARRAPVYPVYSAQPTADGRQAWWAGEHQNLALRDLTTGEDVRALKGASHLSPNLVVPPDGDWLAVGGRVWDVKTGEIIARGDSAAATAVSSDGRLFATAAQGDVVIWEALTRKEIHRWKLDKRECRALAFSPDDTVLVAPDYVDAVVWDMTGRLKNGRLPALALTQAELESLWQVLGSNDHWAAHQAAWTLAAGGEAAVAFIVERLRPATISDPAQIKLLPLSTRLRPPRAVMAMEHSRASAAETLLEALTHGEPAAPLTQAAKSSLARLRQRRALAGGGTTN